MTLLRNATGTAGILCCAALVRADVPNRFSAGEALSAAKLNTNFDNVVDRSSDQTIAGAKTFAGAVGVGAPTPSPFQLVVAAGAGATDASVLRLESLSATAPRQWDFNIKSGNLVVGDNTANQDRLTIDAFGNVGIGSTTPLAGLTPGQMHNGLDLTGWLIVHGNGGIGDQASRIGVVSSDNKGQWFLSSSTGDGHFAVHQAGIGDRLVVAANGRVGIGTATPATDLQVAGDVRVGTSGTSGCVQNAAGGALVGTCSSDARFKRGIEPIEGALAKVERLRPVTYEWRREEFPDRHFGAGRTPGLIAQEVERVAPELVATNHDGYKAVSYGVPLEMLALEAIKELSAKNAALEARLARLEAQLRAR